jgi:hypothetical protein
MRRPAGYSLIGHEPIRFDEIGEWADAWRLLVARRAHIVRQEQIGGSFLSTAFLGFDHNYRDTGPPLLFETMRFDTESTVEARYTTWEEAEAGHEAIATRLRAEILTPAN